VLYDSFLQAQIIAQEVEVSAGRLYAYEDLMAGLEEDRLLDRASEDLPTGEEMAERRRAGRGMERPELALLLAYAKRFVRRELLESPLPDDPYLERDLRGYFPPAVVERFGDRLAEHPLRRELVATINANMVGNALGPTFVSHLQGELGVQISDVVRSFRIAREVTGAAEHWEAIEQLGRDIDRSAITELMAGTDELVEAVTRWYLAHRPGADLGSTIAVGREGFERLFAALDDIGDDAWRERHAERVSRLVERGVPEKLARAHACRRELAQAPDVITTASDAGRSVEEVARAFFVLGQRLRIDWLRAQLDALAPTTRTQRWALHAVRDDTWAAWSKLVRRALEESPGAPVEGAADAFVERRAVQVRRLGAITRSLSVDGTNDLPALMLAVRHLRSLA
jgi:glutamate dehydrogenase